MKTMIAGAACVLSLGLAACSGGAPLGETKEEKLARMSRVCVERLTDGGVQDLEAMKVCDCMIERSKGWIEKNPDADYSQEVHERLVKQCVIWS